MARKPPSQLTGLIPGKILVAEETRTDTWVLLSSDAIAEATAGGDVLWQRPWHEVAGGDWDDEEHTLVVTWVDNQPESRIETARDAPKRFPRVFKERVDATVVYAETERIPGGGRLRAAIRRTPTGELISQISSTTDVPQTPELERRIDELETKLWEMVGY